MKITGSALELVEFVDGLTSRQRVTEDMFHSLSTRDKEEKAGVMETSIRKTTEVKPILPHNEAGLSMDDEDWPESPDGVAYHSWVEQKKAEADKAKRERAKRK